MNYVDPSICEWSAAPYLLVSGNIWGNFIYYSHLFPSITALIIAIFVFKQNPKGKVNQSLLFMATMFTIWCLVDLILWASERSDLIMFFWSILIYFDLLIYASAFYFVYSFLHETWPKWWQELVIALLFVPLFLFTHTKLNLIAFDFTNCWREALEGPLWQYYVYNAELLLVVGIAGISIFAYRRTKDSVKRKEIINVTIGILAFLLSFSFGNITGSIETDWELGQYGLFGMPVFVAFLTYLIIKYQSFDARLVATEALVTGLGILILSLLFIQRIENVQTIAFVTLILTTALGVLLIRSVRNERRQRIEIEKLAKNLEKANARLKILDQMKSEFVSIASHQLRSPLTSIRGYASMILEGSYGNVPQKAREAVERIADSSAFMATSVEDYLNVSRIQAGNMKYEYSDFNLKDKVEKVVDDLRQQAVQHGLVLTFKSDMNFQGIVHADLGKTQQIVHNLINNALKYTEKGTVQVLVHDQKKPKRILVQVTDSGIGMSQETIEKLFGKFERAENANNVNATGTGLGLYIAKKMAEDMGGTISAHSEGEGKGSSFVFELPLQQ